MKNRTKATEICHRLTQIDLKNLICAYLCNQWQIQTLLRRKFHRFGMLAQIKS
jgi:hypothetical protein